MTVSADGGTWCRWASHHHMPHRVQHIVEEGEQARSQVSQLARWVGLADAHLGHPPLAREPIHYLQMLSHSCLVSQSLIHFLSNAAVLDEV